MASRWARVLVVSMLAACSASPSLPAPQRTAASATAPVSAAASAALPPPPVASAAPEPPALPVLEVESEPDPARASRFPPASHFAPIVSYGLSMTVPAIVPARERVLLTAADGSGVLELPAKEARPGLLVGLPHATQIFSALGLALGDEGATTVAAFDVRALQRRWATRAWPPDALALRTAELEASEGTPRNGGALQLSGVLACKTTLVAEFAWASRVGLPKTDLVAFDASRGVVLWRRALRFDSATCANDRVHVERHDEYKASVETLELATGKTLWSVVDEDLKLSAGPPSVAADGMLVSFREPRTGAPVFAVLDAASGKTLWRKPIPARLAQSELEAMQLSRGQLILVAKDKSGSRLVALEAATGSVQWETPAASAGHAATGPWLGFDDDVVLACIGDVLRVYGRAHGAKEWEWGVGTCGGLTSTRARPDAPSMILVASYPIDPKLQRLVGRLTVFARGDRVVAPEGVTIEGTTAPRASVRIGTTVVHADASGHYRAVVEGRGEVSVSGLPVRGPSGHLMLPAEDASVMLDGRATPYRVDFQYMDDGP